MLRKSYPLYKVQKLGKNIRFYTKGMCDVFDLPEANVPERVRRALGFKSKAYMYLNIEAESTCDCAVNFGTLKEIVTRCSHPAKMTIHYEGLESRNRRINW